MSAMEIMTNYVIGELQKLGYKNDSIGPIIMYNSKRNTAMFTYPIDDDRKMFIVDITNKKSKHMGSVKWTEWEDC